MALVLEAMLTTPVSSGTTPVAPAGMPESRRRLRCTYFTCVVAFSNSCSDSYPYPYP